MPIAKLSLKSRLTSFVVLLLIICTVFWTTISSMAVVVWLTETYSHGILVPFVSIWLVYKNRANGLPELDSPWKLCGALIGVVALAWLLGRVGDFKVIQNFAFVAMVILAFGFTMGKDTFFRNAFPILFLLFTVPFGSFLDAYLMQQTADVTVNLLRVTGIPVFQEGLQFKLPTGSWSVIEACSGLRYILASLVLASLFAYLNFNKLTPRLIFVAASILVAILANWIRAYTVVLVGHLSDMRLGTGDDHVWYGWFFFGLVMYLVFWVASKWRDTDDANTNARESSPPSAAIASAPAGRFTRSRIAWFGAVAMSLILVGASAHKLLTIEPIKTVFQAPPKLDGFQNAEKLQFEPHYQDGLSTLRMKSDAPGRPELFAAYFANQSNTQKMISGEHGISVASGGLWRIESFGKKIKSAGGRDFEEAVVQLGPRKRLVLSWFQVGDRQLAGRYPAALATIESVVRGKGDHSYAAFLSIDFENNSDNARSKLLAEVDAVATALAEQIKP